MGDDMQLNHHKNIFKPINKQSVGSWEKSFTDQEKKLLLQYIHKELQLLDYI
jgi:hypothetical protein